MLTGTAAKDYGILPDAEEQLNPVAVERRADGEREWRCKDVFMAIIFLSGVILMAAGLANNMDGLSVQWKNEVQGLQNEFSALTATKMLGASAGCAVVFSAIWLLFVKYCVECAVFGLFALTILAEIAGSTCLFYFANTMEGDGWEKTWLNGLAIAVVCLFCYTVYVLHNLRSRVTLAASLIKVSGGVLEECPGIFLVNSLLALGKFLWLIFCGASTWAILANTEHDKFWVTVGLGLMTYWGLQVLSNIVLVATYGTLGEWYYNGEARICAPLARACTVHFGSTCFGSLLVAMVETAHDVIDIMQKKGYFPQWAMCCIDRVMDSIKSTFEYINKYGFVQVAVHDEPFFSASKRAISFLKYKGLTALMNDSIVSTLATVGAVSGGVLAGVVPVLVQRHINHADLLKVGLSSQQESTLAFSGFVLGSFIVYTLISPFPAMVTGLLVCFAEHPEVLAQAHEEKYLAMIEPWEAVYGADFVDKAATKANLDVESQSSGLVIGQQNPLAEELEKLVTLRHNGTLTEEEFTLAKSKILG